MTALDTEFVPLAAELLTEYGKAATFHVFSGGSYTPASGVGAPGTETTQSRTIIPPYEVERSFVDGDTIRIGDMMTGLAAENLGFTPVAGMKVTIDSHTWTLVRVHPVYSGERIALYQLFLRR